MFEQYFLPLVFIIFFPSPRLRRGRRISRGKNDVILIATDPHKSGSKSAVNGGRFDAVRVLFGPHTKESSVITIELRTATSKDAKLNSDLLSLPGDIGPHWLKY